jgi:hypothetical protein
VHIVGDEWDRAIYARLSATPPPEEAVAEARLQHTLEIVIDTIGPSLRRYLAVALPALRRAVPAGRGDPVQRFVVRLASHYLTMHDAMTHGPHVVSGWSEACAQAAAFAEGRPRIVATFQLGLPLLLPLLLKEGARRRVRVLVHDRHPQVLAFFRRHLGADAPMTLQSTATSAIVAALRGGADVIANIDVAYPGTRTLPMRLSVGTLSVPAGLPVLAKRSGVMLHPMSLIETGASLRLYAGDAVDAARFPDPASAIAATGAFFGLVIAAAPEHWMGWPSLTLPEDAANG